MMQRNSDARFVLEDGTEILSASAFPRLCRPGDAISLGGTLERPARRFVVTDAPATHHCFDGTIGAQWLSTYFVRELK